jgi:hopanoid-associated phosphorylase
VKVLAVTGLTKEARIVAGPRFEVIAGGGNRSGLERQLAFVSSREIAAVVSFGIAGALDPDLRVGDILLATSVTHEGETRPAAASLVQGWARRLESAGLPYRLVTVAGVDAPLLSPADKVALRASTGAGAVDMESHLAAAFAARRGLPFAALRVVSDRTEDVLPPVAGSAMRPDGSVDVFGVLAGLARDPGQVPALVRTARDAAVAFRTLRRVRGLLGDLLGLDL